MDFREGLRTLREVAEGTVERTKAVAKAVATDLVSYEAFNSAIEALMRFYNGKLKEKVSKSGDTMTGNLIIDKGATTDGSMIKLNTSQKVRGELYVNTTQNAVELYNAISRAALRLFDDGGATLNANNLKTQSKEIIGAVNELYADKQNITDNKLQFKNKNVVENINESFYRFIPKEIGVVGSNTLADFRMIGHFYGNIADGVQWTDLPKGITEHSFELYNGSASPSTRDDKEYYCSQRIKNRNSEREFIRGISGDIRPWAEILNTSSPMYLGHIGLSQLKTIQEVGEKTPPNVYIDDETGKPYRCLVRNSDRVPTSRFEPIDNNSLSNNGFEYGTQVIDGYTWHWQLNKKTKVLEQWSLLTVTGYEQKTLPKAYTDKNYTIIANSGNMSANSTVSAQGETPNAFSIKTTLGSQPNKVYVYTVGVIGG